MLLGHAADIVESRMRKKGLDAETCGLPAYEVYGILTLGLSEVEHVGLACFDVNQRFLGATRINTGTVDRANTHYREVLREALALNAAKCILYHSHPSGDPTPSLSDIEGTQQVADALGVVGIGLHDHVVVAGGESRSMLREGLLSSPGILVPQKPSGPPVFTHPAVAEALGKVAEAGPSLPPGQPGGADGLDTRVVAGEASQECGAGGADLAVHFNARNHSCGWQALHGASLAERAKEVAIGAIERGSVNVGLLRALPTDSGPLPATEHEFNQAIEPVAREAYGLAEALAPLACLGVFDAMLSIAGTKNVISASRLGALDDLCVKFEVDRVRKSAGPQSATPSVDVPEMAR